MNNINNYLHYITENQLSNDLVLKNLALVPYVCKNIPEGVLPFEDIIQYGNEGLIRAAKTYDPNRGKFSTYAFYFIRAYVYRQIKKEQKRQNIICSGSVDDIEDQDITVEVEDNFDGDEKYGKLLDIMVTVLNEREFEVIQMRYLDVPHLTLDNIGKMFGVTRERIRQIEVEALAKLRPSKVLRGLI